MTEPEPSTGAGEPERAGAVPSTPVWVLVVVLAGTAFALAFAVRHTVFPYYSLDHDEPVYRLQAQMLEDGEVTLPRSQERFYRPWLSGPHGDHLVLAFPPGWPAILAGSDLLTGSMIPALGLAAALVTVGMFLLANEILRSPPRALAAAALVSLSPFAVMLSGTYLDYLWSLGLGLVFSFLLLRGSRTRSLAMTAAGGAVWGIAFLTRPYDALLMLLPVAVFIVCTTWRDRRALLRVVVAAALAALPFLVLTGIDNVLIAGNPFRFSTMVQSGNLARFGWGDRAIAPHTAVVHFTIAKALRSLLENLWGLPTWLLGTYVAVALAVVGAWRLRHDRRRLWLLVGMLVVVPLGYLGWFASVLTAPGAFTGLGPHYYVPMLAPLAILTAEGLFVLWERRAAWTAATAVAGVAATAAFIPSKLDDKRQVVRESRAFARAIRDAIAPAGNRDVLVVLKPGPEPYVLEPFPFLANTPRLDGHVVYALDRGPGMLDLLREQDRRVPFRIVRRFGTDANDVPAAIEPITAVSRPVVTIRAHLVNTSGTPNVVAYLGVGDAIERRLVDRASSPGKAYDVEWTIAADGSVRYDGPPAGALASPAALPPSGLLTVGIASGDDLVPDHEGGSEIRYPYRRRDGEVQVVTAGEGWVHFGGKVHGSLPADTDAALTVSFS